MNMLCIEMQDKNSVSSYMKLFLNFLQRNKIRCTQFLVQRVDAKLNIVTTEASATHFL